MIQCVACVWGVSDSTCVPGLRLSDLRLLLGTPDLLL